MNHRIDREIKKCPAKIKKANQMTGSLPKYTFF